MRCRVSAHRMCVIWPQIVDMNTVLPPALPHTRLRSKFCPYRFIGAVWSIVTFPNAICKKKIPCQQYNVMHRYWYTADHKYGHGLHWVTGMPLSHPKKVWQKMQWIDHIGKTPPTLRTHYSEGYRYDGGNREKSSKKCRVIHYDNLTSGAYDISHVCLSLVTGAQRYNHIDYVPSFVRFINENHIFDADPIYCREL